MAAEIHARPLEGLKVLVTEDNLVISLDIEALLMDLGAAEVRIVADERTALDAIEAERPDFAILDMMLAQGSGANVAERLAHRGAPFIFVSGSDMADRPDQFSDVVVLPKPFTHAGFERACREALGLPEARTGDG